MAAWGTCSFRERNSLCHACGPFRPIRKLKKGRTDHRSIDHVGRVGTRAPRRTRCGREWCHPILTRSSARWSGKLFPPSCKSSAVLAASETLTLRAIRRVDKLSEREQLELILYIQIKTLL